MFLSYSNFVVKGVLYIATGDDFVNEATRSARNTRRKVDLPITLITDSEREIDVFDQVIVDDRPTYSFADKVRNIGKSPYEKTLFIDTDVYLLKDISGVFDVLEKKDISTTIDPNEWELRFERDHAFDSIPEEYPLFQTGVIGFRDSENTRELFNRWTEFHDPEIMRSDQSSFRAAMFNTDIQHAPLSDLYNCLIGWPMQVTGEVKVIHDTLEHIQSQADIDRVESALNDSHNPRHLYTFGEEVHTPFSPKFDQILGKIHRFGRSILRK